MDRVIALALIWVLFCGISAPQRTFNAHFMNRLKLACFWKYELPKKDISLLDIGTGASIFLERIEKYFRELGYNVKVTGIDNGDVIHTSSVDNEMRREFTDYRKRDVRIIFGDILKHPFGHEKFDVISLLAPHSATRSVYDLIEAGLEHLRPDGIFYVQFFEGEGDSYVIDRIKEMCEEKGWYFLKSRQDSMPIGDYPLECQTYFIRKQEFKSNFEIVAKSLGELRKQETELRKAT